MITKQMHHVKEKVISYFSNSMNCVDCDRVFSYSLSCLRGQNKWTRQQQKKTWTEKELMSLPKEGYKYEMIQGELVMGPAGIEHEEIGAHLLTALRKFVSERKLGIVCGSSAGYWMKSGNLRSPDVSFIRKERLQGCKRPPKGFFKGSPDIAIEILSPTDTVESLHGKIVEYFENDTKLAWVVNPEEQTVLVYRSPQPRKLLTKNDLLDGEEVLKGFTFPIAELFAEI